MEKIITITLVLSFFLTYFVVSSKIKGNASDVKISYNEDGSVKYIFPDGSTKIVQMDGKTPYGTDIKEEKKRIKKKKFIVDIIYSKMHSDDNMNKYTKRFYESLVSQMRKQLSKIEVSPSSMKVLISNCKYCRTGYCKRVNRKGLTIFVYNNTKKKREFTISFAEIMDKKTYEDIAISASNQIFK